MVCGRTKVEKEEVEPGSHDFHFLPETRYNKAGNRPEGRGAEEGEIQQGEGEGNQDALSFFRKIIINHD